MFLKLDRYVTQLKTDEEEKYSQSQKTTLNMLANASHKELSAEVIPEQLMGALQLYGYFRDHLKQDPVAFLTQGLDALTKSITALDAKI